MKEGLQWSDLDLFVRGTLETAPAPLIDADMTRTALSRLEVNRDRFITRDPGFQRKLASALAEMLATARLKSGMLSEYDISEILGRLRETLWFAHYVLLIDDEADEVALSRHAASLAMHLPDGLIFAAPTNPEGSLVDPSAPLEKALSTPASWPGALVWTKSGASVMIPAAGLDEIVRVLRKTRSTIPSDLVVDVERSDDTCRLLQLSDLHFGTDQAAVNEPLLTSHLRRVTRTSPFRRVILSGDLMDNPNRDAALAYRRFFHDTVASISLEEPFIVPGNHDQKWMGNLGRELTELARIQWSSLVVDDVGRYVLLGFDSSRDANLARGCVSAEQRADIAVRFDNACARNEGIDEYLKIAVIHHHPYSFDTAPDTLLQRMLASVGLTDERFLKMVDAQDFLSWCARQRVGLILHGHKHVPRHVIGSVDCETDRGTTARPITAIGCGTSLGAENKPLSYNVIAIDPKSRRWSTSFFAGKADGGGFFRQCITTVHR